MPRAPRSASLTSRPPAGMTPAEARRRFAQATHILLRGIERCDAAKSLPDAPAMQTSSDAFIMKQEER